ncbi:TIGR04141 family sporadically distributed protein [Pseudoalteromonas sp. NJ631]|uniref:TIGR04141 family sporadically distributed protein n=1 Tax=Pseudoalteromonas sp. NJ631 TaxID=493915 RepID=UPI0002DA603D|nr:TIGR04141 family sporadically distributed protein [Pseudoalteromonas sp. NJ631]
MLKVTPLSIYLLKSEESSNTSVIKLNDAKSHNVEIEGTTSTLHVQIPTSNPPAFAGLFHADNQLNDVDFGTNQSTGAVLEVRHAGKTFFIAFGTGYHMLEMSCMVPDFGLRTALNLVERKDIRGIDTASNKHTPLNNRIQSGLGIEVSDFPIDIDEDFLSAIEGASSEKIFGSRVAGRRKALRINYKGTLNDLPSLLLRAYLKYCEELPNEFKWVDNIREVTESSVTTSLDIELIKCLVNLYKNGPTTGDNLMLIAPEVYESEQITGFSYGARNKERSDLLCLERYLSYIMQKENQLNLKHLQVAHKIYAKDDNHKTLKRWSGYECIYCELIHNGKHYELRAGVWYEINTDFVKEINTVMGRIPIYPVALPEYNHDSEGDYNKDVAANDTNIECLDTKNIYIGGGQSRFEFCDLVNLNNGHDKLTDLIHVKHYTSSATLSHLFSQGIVSAEIFRASEVARQKLYTNHPGVMPLTDPEAMPDTGKYRVVYAIYDIAELPTKLPFFSKVNLKNAYNRLKVLGYEVALAHIEVSRSKIIKRKCKKQANKKRVSAAA